MSATEILSGPGAVFLNTLSKVGWSPSNIMSVLYFSRLLLVTSSGICSS